ncbi:MAG: hypothetical protein QXS41_04095 [Candidatus Woesearchaeota archaeon]
MALFDFLKPKKVSKKIDSKGNKKVNEKVKKDKKSLKKKSEKEIEENFDKYLIYSRSVIEVVGKPQDYVKELLKQIKDKVKENHYVKSYKTFKPKLVDEKLELFEGFLELEIYFKNVDEMIAFLHNFYPSSFEIYESKISFSLSEINSMLNSELYKLHELGLALKEVSAQNAILNAENQQLKDISQKLIENLILVALRTHEKLTYEEISKITGLENFELQLENLVKENKVKKDGSYYYR